jgi:uncharacterized protein
LLRRNLHSGHWMRGRLFAQSLQSRMLIDRNRTDIVSEGGRKVNGVSHVPKVPDRAAQLLLRAILPCMPTIDKHPAGAFCWIELGTSDQKAAKSFYESLFGWSSVDTPMGPDEFYTLFKLDGQDAAAAYTLRKGQKEQGVPPNWMIYVAVESADAAAAKVTENGGTVIMPPFDVWDLGRMAACIDPTGAVFSLWQAKNHKGTGIAGTPGTLCWADLSSPDSETARRFYASVFGWNIFPGENDPSGYLHIKNGDQFIGGIQTAKERNPNAPPHWLPYYLVSSCDASSTKAKGLGATLFLQPTHMETVGTFSVLADPQGAVFALFEPAHQT